MEVFKKALLDAVLEEYKELENHKTASQARGLGANNSLWIDTEHQRLYLTMAENCVQCYFRKVEDDFMAKAPTDAEDLWRFIDEIPYWTAQKHGKKYRLMYQVYTHPKYREYGKKFFAGVDERYTEYAKNLEGKLGIPHERITPLIFILIRACVHYALFEDEFYLKSQMAVLKETLELFIMKYNLKISS